MAVRRREPLVTGGLIVLLVFLLYQAYVLLGMFLPAFFWGGVLAFLVYPVHERLLRLARPRLSAGASAGLVTAVVVLALILPLISLTIRFVAQAVDWYQAAVAFIESGQLSQWVETTLASPLAHRLQPWLGGQAGQGEGAVGPRVEAWLLDVSRTAGSVVARGAGGVVTGAAATVVNVVVACWALFVCLLRGRALVAVVREVSPFTERMKDLVFGQLNEALTAVVRGQLLTAALQAVVAGIIYAALGVPYPVFFGALTFVASFIPGLGSVGVWLPLAGYLAVLHEQVRAVLLVILGFLVIGTIDNLLRPLLIGNRTRLPYSLLLLSILGGAQAYGLMGIFLGPVILSLLMVLVQAYLRDRRAQAGTARTGA
jgi:predicted PurR-regulated permease PerM